MPMFPRRTRGASPILTALLPRCLGLLLACAPCPTLHAQAPSVAILVYHRFADHVNDSMTVRTSTFEAQLAWLRAHGYRCVPLRDVLAWLRDPAAELPPRSVALTADDGHRSVYDVLAPIARRDHLPVTLFIYPSAISNASYAMTWQQLRELRATGLFDVQSHTYWHPNFHVERRRRGDADYQAFVDTQLIRSKEKLQQELGSAVDQLAWPFGIDDAQLRDRAVLAGYVAGFTLEARPVRRGDTVMALPRFLITDAVTPAVLGRLLGERDAPRASTGSP